MAVFQYTARVKREDEDHVESGTVVAKTEVEARSKLKRLDLNVLRVKRLGVIAGFFKALTADIK